MAKKKGPSAPVLTTAHDWAQRLGQLSQVVPSDKMQAVGQIAKQDIQSVAQGGQALTHDQWLTNTIDAIRGGTGVGKNIMEPKKPDTSIWGDITGGIGHAISDIKNVGENAIPGLMHQAVGLLSGSTEKGFYEFLAHSGDNKWLKKHGYEAVSSNLLDPGSWAAALRDVSKAPLTQLFPGLHTVAALTTPGGRESLLHHPIYTTLDVGAAAAGLGSAGLLGKTAEAGTPLEALQAGHPFSAAYKALAPASTQAAVSGTVEEALKAVSMNPASKALIRVWSQGGRRTQQISANLAQKYGLDKISEYLVAHPEEDKLFTHEMQTGHFTSPVHRQWADAIQKFHNDMAESETKLHGVKHDGQKWIYPENSPVVKNQDVMFREGARLKRITKEEKGYIQQQAVREIGKFRSRETTAARDLVSMKERLQTLRGNQTRREVLARKYARSVPVLHRHMDLVENQMKRIAAKEAEIKGIQDQITNIFSSDRTIRVHANRIQAARDRYIKSRENFANSFGKEPPAPLMPILSQKYEGIIKDTITDKLNKEGASPETISAALDDWAHTAQTSVLQPKELADIKASVFGGWQDWLKNNNGEVPLFYHEVTPGKPYNAYLRPLTDRELTVSMVKKRTGDMTPATDSIALSLNREIAEYAQKQATDYFIEHGMMPHVATWGDVKKEIQNNVDIEVAKNGGVPPRGMDLRGMMQAEVQKRYSVWNPSTPFDEPAIIKLNGLTDDTQLIDKHYLSLARRLNKGPSTSGLARVNRAGTHAYKSSVMRLSTKHTVHVTMGQMVMMMLRGGKEEVANFPSTFMIWKHGQLPDYLSQLDPRIPRGDPSVDDFDQAMAYNVGKKNANLLTQFYQKTLGRAANWMQKWDDNITDIYRADSYISEVQRQERAGIHDEAARDNAAEHVYKTFVNTDDFTPFERTIQSTVFPWYAYMKNVLEFMFTFPIDYPLRAGVLARIAQQEEENQKSGLPGIFNSLFYMGKPNAAGQVTGVEMKQFNPFRDVPNYFTTAGFTTALRPDLGIALQAMDVNRFSGKADLYPQLTYDSFHGTEVPVSPSAGAFVTQFAEQVVPEAGALDYYAGLSQQMRQLRASNPEAARNALYNSLLIPFEPKHINVVTEAGKIQNDKLANATQDVSASMKDGDTARLMKYNYVPFEGMLLPPGQVAAYIEQLNKEVAGTGLSPKAVSSSTALKPKKKRR